MPSWRMWAGVVVGLGLLALGVWAAMRAAAVPNPDSGWIDATVAAIRDERVIGWQRKSSRAGAALEGRAPYKLFGTSARYLGCSDLLPGSARDNLGIRTCQVRSARRKARVTSWRYPQHRYELDVEYTVDSATRIAPLTVYRPFVPAGPATAQHPGRLAVGDTVRVFHRSDEPDRVTLDDTTGDSSKDGQERFGFGGLAAVALLLGLVLLAAVWFSWKPDRGVRPTVVDDTDWTSDLWRAH